MRRQDLFLPFAGIYASLNQCRIEIKGFRDALQFLINTGYITSTERIPYRMMDLDYTLGNAGIIKDFQKVKSFFNMSLLSKETLVLLFTEHDTYAITHAIIYLTDFGFRNDLISSKKISNICWLLSALLGLYIHIKNLDILAELLICCHCMNWFPYPDYYIAWKCLLDGQRNDGSMPGPYFDEDKFKSLQDKSNRYKFEQNYHTTIVTLMACIIANKNIENKLPYKFAFNFKKILEYDKVLDISKRAHEWLNKFCSPLHYEEYDQSSLLQILLGNWIYYLGITKSIPDTLKQDAKNILNKFDLLYEDSEKTINCDAGLALLATGMFRKLNLESDPLEEFTQKASNVLKNYSPENSRDFLNLFQTNFLVSRLCSVTMETWNIPNNELKENLQQFYNNKESLQYISNYISFKTLFGKKRLLLEKKLMSELYLAISSNLLYHLYKYDLDMSLKLLRCMLYLHQNKSKTFIQTIDFITLQHHLDGYIGFFAPEVSELSIQGHDFNQKNALYIPITVSSLWAFAETLNHDFSLLYSI